MDQFTITTYDEHAQDFAAAQRDKTPEALRRLLLAYFRPGGPTADIGCGSGRDTAWLAGQGFAALGYDASAGMLREARRAFPGLEFGLAALPDLAGVATGSYRNVLCSAVIMHLPQASLPAALAGLARILVPEGRLVLTYRGSQATAPREADGRLYSPIEAHELARHCASVGLRMLHQTAAADGGRAGVLWHVLVAERS
jgi:SAM-dependent methyltransferase